MDKLKDLLVIGVAAALVLLWFSIEFTPRPPVIGKSTAAQFLRGLGPPSAVQVLEDGSQVFVYPELEFQYWRLIFSDDPYVRAYDHVYVFDAGGVLRSHHTQP